MEINFNLIQKHLSLKEIIQLGVYSAIIIIFSFIPQTGYITIGPIAITTLPAVVALATYHLGGKGACVSSFTFALFSYIAGITIWPSPIAHPLILIVPRIILGLALWITYLIIGKIKLWKYILLTFFSYFYNTFLVTSGLFLVSSYLTIWTGTFKAWVILIYVNVLFEWSFGIFFSLFTYQLIIHLIKNNQNKFNNSWN